MNAKAFRHFYRGMMNRSEVLNWLQDEDRGWEELPEDIQIEQVHQGARAYHLVWLNGQRYQPGEFLDYFHDDHEPDISAWLARLDNGLPSLSGGSQ